MREAERNRQRNGRGSAELSRSGGGLGGGDHLTQAELTTLRKENARLKEELSHFDLDFFEEIEDLKFKYAEALRKLRAYEG